MSATPSITPTARSQTTTQVQQRPAAKMSSTSPSIATKDGEDLPWNTRDQINSSDSRQMSNLAASTSKSSWSSWDWESALASEVTYCLVSAGTVLINKHALSSFDFPAPNTLLLFQFVLACVLLKILDVTGILNLQPIRWEVVKLWLPCNLIFVAMNVTGFYALQDIGAGMFTVLKNLSNLMTIVGDYIIFGNTYSWQVWLCLGLMVMSALLGGWTDLTFSMNGYAWQLVNCCFTAAYSLYLGGVIKRLSKERHDKQQLSEMSMVYYNNLLSVPPLALLSLSSGEYWRLLDYHHIFNLEFQVVAVVGGLFGFCVSFASIWCMSRTSPTIYSLTGSLNKVIVALVGMWFFREGTNMLNLLSIATGLAAGFLFVFARSTSKQQQSHLAQHGSGDEGKAGDEEAGGKVTPVWPDLRDRESVRLNGVPMGTAVAGSQAALLESPSQEHVTTGLDALGADANGWCIYSEAAGTSHMAHH
eukprot:CAMPEP_0202881308 /NCGR_PEP_ID=MMETSP1391-20130828/36339_1 /ASSEMBLY_ACC=CAM_ASM_000867 /TAXON_ID=1034604 /ORGANISM="Chlamydomonas leiostraca, Strain SAG 11-49" /LENGTH=473 /DNA_ID=CAMNT_0049563971 /DNA_START=12 /DNA_END=1432 /DNA_ORIENTATION=-